MRKQQRDRKAISQDRKSGHEMMAENKPSASAARAFVRKAYECCDVAGYMARKYNVKERMDAGGQENP